MKTIVLRGVSILILGALLIGAYGGIISPNWIIGIVVLLFPVLLFCACMWGIVLGLFKQWRLAGTVAAALLIALPQILTVFPLHPFKTNDEPHDSMFSVMTYNVAAFSHLFTADSSQVMRTILDIDADFVLMQEMPHAVIPFDYDTIKGLKPYYNELCKKFPYRTHPYKDEVAILSKYPFTVDTIVAVKRGFDTLNYMQDLEHYPALAFDVEVNGYKLRLISTHLQSYGLSSNDKRITGTNTDNDHDVMQGSRVDGMTMPQKLARAFGMRALEAQALRQAIDAGPESVILCGDFNDVQGSYSYRTLMGNDMRDSWAECGMGYTHTYSQHRFYFKIDHILYRGNLKAIDSQVYTNVPYTLTSSDHYPQVTTFQFIK